MKKLLSLVAVLGSSYVAMSQTTYPCVTGTSLNSNSTWKVSEYTVETQEFKDLGIDLGASYTRNTFLKYKGIEQYAYATREGNTSTIHVENSSGAHFRSARFNENVLSLNYSEQENKLIYLATREIPNYYDFLSQDVSINILDLETNKVKNVTIPTFSIFVPSLPYVGQQTKLDNRGFLQTHNYSISLPTINTDLQEYMFVAKDIPGFNRLVKMNIFTNDIRTISVNADVLSITYHSKEKVLKALIVEGNKAANNARYFVADLDSKTGKISNKVEVATNNIWNETELNGTIQYDVETDVLLVTKIVNAKKMMFQLDAKTNETVETTTLASNADFFVPVQSAPSAPEAFNLSAHVTVYPNPTASTVRITTDKDALVTGLKLMDATGKVIRNIDVQSQSVTNEIDIQHLLQGVYYLSVQSGEHTHVEKVVKY